MSAMLGVPPILGPVSGDGLARLLVSESCLASPVCVWKWVRSE